MADIKGTNLASPVTPFTTDDKYPTHYAEYGHGGYRSVATLEEMADIPEQRLADGCKCYVRETDKEYQYNAADKQWVECKQLSDDAVDGIEALRTRYNTDKSNGYIGTFSEWLTAMKIEVVDNLTTDSATKALSARQGMVLKGLIDKSTKWYNIK